MSSKKEKTSLFIVEAAASIFIKNGFAGASMGLLTAATGLTKGAIYGNFKDKQDLAIKTFNHIVKKAFEPVASSMFSQPSATLKLKAMIAYYRDKYPKYMEEIGGCPLLSVSINSKYVNEALFARVKSVVKKLKHNLVLIIQEGIRQGEFKPDLDADKFASRIYATIQGSIFLLTTLGDTAHLADMMDQLDRMVDEEMVIKK